MTFSECSRTLNWFVYTDFVPMQMFLFAGQEITPSGIQTIWVIFPHIVISELVIKLQSCRFILSKLCCEQFIQLNFDVDILLSKSTILIKFQVTHGRSGKKDLSSEGSQIAT